MGISNSSKGLPFLNKSKYQLSMVIDTANSAFNFFRISGNDFNSLEFDSKKFKGKIFDKDFDSQMTQSMQDFAKDYSVVPSETQFTLVLPDTSIAQTTITLPTLNKRKMADSLEAYISTLYKNKEALKINEYLATSNKHQTTFSLTVINQPLFTSLVSTCVAGTIPTSCVTFAGNCVGNAVAVLNPKFKNSSYVFLDVKENSSRIIFAAKGRTTGTYSLPFGYSILEKNRLAAEDMLFDHPTAELAVLNAKEKARAKQLTMARVDTPEDEENKSEMDMEYDDPTKTRVVTAEEIKVLPKKMPRKLPKNMLRPQPESEEEYAYENFRIFQKWVLNLINANDRLTSQGYPEAVYVNVPDEFGYLCDMANSEIEENGIQFMNFDTDYHSKYVKENLDLFGGLYAINMNRTNNF